MGRRPSLIWETCVRFDELKSGIGHSRFQERQRLRAEAHADGRRIDLMGFSTGRIHSDKTLEVYKGIALRYSHYAREVHAIRRLADLDQAAPQLVDAYLAARSAAGDRPSSLKTIRSALRMYHGVACTSGERAARVRLLGAAVPIPPRRREEIIRSRHAVEMDRHIILAHAAAAICLAEAFGLRRRELCALTVGAIHQSGDGTLVAEVTNGKGGKRRTVPILPEKDECVRALIVNRDPEETVVDRVHVRLDIHHYRIVYARALYTENGRRALPSPDGRLTPGSIDRERALYVSRALGHARLDVVLRHYLR